MADWIEQLERLTQLHKAGALTDEEFAAQKARLLAASNQPASPPPPPPPVVAPVPPAYTPEPVAAAPAWEPADEEPARSGGVPKWVLVAVPAALAVLAAAAWFGSSLGSGGPDPQLSGAAEATDAAVAIATPTEEAPPPVALDGSLTFAAANNCQAAQTLETVYKKLDAAGELGSGRGMTVTLGGFEKPLAIEAKKTTDAEGIETRSASVRFPANTTWHGLKLSRLTTTTTIVPESDGGYTRTVNFVESPDKVLKTLSRLGFAAPKEPDYKELTDDACGGSMAITSINGGATLSCSWGC